MKIHYGAYKIKIKYLTHWRYTTLVSLKLEYPEKKRF